MEALKDKTSKLGGREARASDASLSISEAIIEASKPSTEAGARFIKARVLDPRTIKTVEDIRDRRELTETFRQANEQLLEYLSNLAQNSRKVTDGRGLTSEEVATIVSRIVGSPSMQLVLRKRRLDKTIAENSLGILDLLEKNWGDWKIQEDKLVFTDSDVMETYSTLLHGTHEATKEQADIQKRIIERMKN